MYLAAQIVVVRQQADGFEQQIVEIERVGLAQPLFVLLVDRRQCAPFFRSVEPPYMSSGDFLWLLLWLIQEVMARYCMNFSSRPAALKMDLISAT